MEPILPLQWLHWTPLYCWWLHVSLQYYKENVLLCFHGNSCYENAQRCYVMPTLPILFFISSRDVLPIISLSNRRFLASLIFHERLRLSLETIVLKSSGWKNIIQSKLTSWENGNFSYILRTRLSQDGVSWIWVRHSRRRPGECAEKGSQITRNSLVPPQQIKPRRSLVPPSKIVIHRVL
jgi:hypothetical protein